MTGLLSSVQTSQDLAPLTLGQALVMAAAAIVLTAAFWAPALHAAWRETRRNAPRPRLPEPTVPRQLTHDTSHRQEINP